MRHLSTILGCAALTMLIASPGLTAEPEHIRGKASTKRAASAPTPARGESAQQDGRRERAARR